MLALLVINKKKLFMWANVDNFYEGPTFCSGRQKGENCHREWFKSGGDVWAEYEWGHQWAVDHTLKYVSYWASHPAVEKDKLRTVPDMLYVQYEQHRYTRLKRTM